MAARAPVHVTRHAILRMRQRTGLASLQEAAETLELLAATAQWRPRPRHWMRAAHRRGSVTYGYSSAAPDVCLIRLSDVIVTILTRSMFPRVADDPAPRQRRPRCGSGRDRYKRGKPERRPSAHAHLWEDVA